MAKAVAAILKEKAAIENETDEYLCMHPTVRALVPVPDIICQSHNVLQSHRIAAINNMRGIFK